MQQYMKLMGLECEDKVTGFKGFVECVSFDLYGCVQVALRSKANKEGKSESGWYDHKRLKVIGKKPVMAVPNYEESTQEAVSRPKPVGHENGPAAKPAGRT